jgi:hypothetical protein
VSDTIEIDGKVYTRCRVIAGRASRSDPVTAKGQLAKANSDSAEMAWYDQNNPDLVHVQFMLDTEGPNANWDLQTRAEMVRAHHTAKFKPIDMEHIIVEHASMMYGSKSQPPVANTICGVITGTALAWATSGQLLTPEEVKNLDLSDDVNRADDKKLGIMAWGAMYKFLFPKTVAHVIDAIDDKQMAVSMERWIAAYDFLVWDEASAQWTVVTQAEAKKDGTLGKWSMKQKKGDKPIYRRTNSCVYGGVANTSNPANQLSQFFPIVQQKANANLSPEKKILLDGLKAYHDQLHAKYAKVAASERKAIEEEHERVTRAIADLVRQ